MKRPSGWLVACIFKLLLGASALLPHTLFAATCFAVDDDTARIVVFNRDPPPTIRFNAVITNGVGGANLPAERIESAYFDAVQNRYYIIVQDTPNRFGYVDPFSGAFIEVSASMGTTVAPTVKVVGTGNGANGIRGLTRNPVTGRWYIIDFNGFLFELNPTTGQFVPGSFGGNDHIRVAGPLGTFYTNVEDLAFDSTGELFVIRNDPGAEQLLRRVSLITGRAAATADTGLNEAEGLALTDGNMRLIIGGSGGANSRNFYDLDVTTGATTLVFNLPSPSGTPADYEAQGCNDSFPRADLALTKTVTPGAAPPGGTVTYTLVLVNQGIDPAYRVQVTDVLDTGMSFVSSSIHPSCTVCSFNVVGSNGTWTVDSIDIGQRRTITLVASTVGVPSDTFVVNRAQVTQSCDAAVGACVALADFDSTPNNKVGSWSPTEDDEATAGLLVTVLPSVGKTFNPTNGLAAETSTLVITFTNPNVATPGTLTAVFTDAYPLGLVNYSTPNPQTSCLNGAVASAVAGGTSVSLSAGSVIPANSLCTLTVVVTASAVGVYTNTVAVGSLTTAVGNNAVGATAQYQVTPANINVIKDFTPDAAGVGGSSTMQLTFSNPTSVTALFTAGFTDNYPAGLVNYATPAVATTCTGSGAPVAAPGASSLTLPNTRSIPPSGSCSVTVVVTSAATGNYINSIPTGSASTSVGRNLGTATAPMLFDAPSVSKRFTPSAAVTGATSTLIITFTNPLATIATLSAGGFTDIYPAGIINHTTPAVADTCAGGNAVATAGLGTVTLPAGTQIPALSTCQLSVVVRGTPSLSLTGTFVNTIPVGSLSTNLGSNSSPATATLTLSTLTDLRVLKASSISSGTPGQTFSYTVTVVNLGPSAAASLTFADTFNGIGLTSTVIVGTAGVGATVHTLATTTTSINATLTLPLNGTATFRFNVIPTLFSGFVTNTAAVLPRAGTVDSNTNNNTATVAVSISPTSVVNVAKTNGVATLPAGSTTHYTITFVNNGPSDASGAVVTDPTATGLACPSLTCNATGGADCGSMTVGALAGGHPLPSFPSGSTVTVILSCAVTATGS